jgi:hypothetical protein
MSNRNGKHVDKAPTISLDGLDKQAKVRLLLHMAIELVDGLKSGRVRLPQAEAVLFNIEKRMFASRVLKHRPLTHVIEAGMELEDVREVLKSREAFVRACDDIKRAATAALKARAKRAAA